MINRICQVLLLLALSTVAIADGEQIGVTAQASEEAVPDWLGIGAIVLTGIVFLLAVASTHFDVFDDPGSDEPRPSPRDAGHSPLPQH